jgi:O-antigen ligase
MLFAVALAVFGILSRELDNGLVYWFWKPRTGGGSNAFGPFINRNHFAGWMVMACCLCTGALLGHIERLDKPTASERHKKPWISSPVFNQLIPSLVMVAIMAISLVWTMSRSGIISFTVAIACFTGLAAMRWRAQRVRGIAGIAALALVVATSVAWRGPLQIVRWFGETRDLYGRFDAWRDGWHVVRDFPLTGTGINTYSPMMLFYQTSNLNLHLAQAHNDYLQLLAEGGLLVAIPAAIFLVCLVVVVTRNVRAASREARGYWIRVGAAVGLLSIGVQEIAEFSLQMPANALLFCTLAAIALAPVRTDHPVS